MDQYIFTLSVPSWHVEGQLSISHINDRQQTIVLEMWSLPITRIDAADVEGTGFGMLLYRLQSMQLIGQEQNEIVLFMCQQ